MWTSETSNKFLLVHQSGIIKNIVYEILRECDKHDFVCEKKFVTFVVHLISLRFKDDANFVKEFNRKTIEELIGFCLNVIIGKITTNCWRKSEKISSHFRLERHADEHNFEDASFLH